MQFSKVARRIRPRGPLPAAAESASDTELIRIALGHSSKEHWDLGKALVHTWGVFAVFAACRPLCRSGERSSYKEVPAVPTEIGRSSDRSETSVPVVLDDDL